MHRPRRTPVPAGALAVVLAAALGASAHAADDVMRCGGSLITVGMLAAQIVAKCGEPQAKAVEEVPIRVRRQTGAVNTIGVTQVERWTYDRGAGQFPALLTFEEGKLKSLEIVAKH
jgi:uncharacterized protein DUF2845